MTRRRSKPSRLSYRRWAARAGGRVPEKCGWAARVAVPLVLAILVVASTAAAPVPPPGRPGAVQAQQREVRRTFTASEGTIVDLENLAG